MEFVRRLPLDVINRLLMGNNCKIILVGLLLIIPHQSNCQIQTEGLIVDSVYIFHIESDALRGKTRLMMYPDGNTLSKQFADTFQLNDCQIFFILKMIGVGSIQFESIKTACTENIDEINAIEEYIRKEVWFFILDNDYEIKTDSTLISFSIRI